MSAPAEPSGKTPADKFVIPAGWTLYHDEHGPTLVGPEQDLRIRFIEGAMGSTLQQTALDAWRRIKPDFSARVVQEAAVPGERWDEICQIMYSVPASESRFEIAIVRRMGQHAYINLITGTNAAAGRRGAQMTEIVRSWKPEGFKETVLSAQAGGHWNEQHSRQLREFIVSAMAAFGVPGVSFAIAQHGQVVYADGLGVRSLDNPEPVTAHTRFMIGSATKPLTTLMMAKLVDQKKLNWSTPVVDLLKDFALADEQITQRLELRHTASASTGMPRQDMEFIFKYSGITPEARLAQMKRMRPTTGFGETFQYSNLLVAAGGYAAARAYMPTGSLRDAFEKAMAELVFASLEMRNTFFRQEEAMEGEWAAPHATDFEGKTRAISLQFEKAVYSVGPAGAAWSTAPDLARYVLLELGRGRLPGSAPLISEEALLERRKKGIKIDEKNSYGLGLIISDDCGLQVIHHGGNTLGFTTDMYFLPESDLGVVILSNLYAANGLLLAVRQKIFEMLFGAEAKVEKMIQAAVTAKQDWLARLHERVKSDPTSIAWIRELLGSYQNEELGNLKVVRKGETYWMELEEWESLLASEIQPGGDHLVRLVSPPWSGTLKMLVTPTGDLSLDAGQAKYVFRRQTP